MMKNRGLGFGFGFLMEIMSLSSVSALNLDNVTRGISDVFGWIFGFLLNTTKYDVYFFEKILFLILVFLIIKMSLQTLPPFEDKSKTGIVNIISIAVSLIGVRYLTELDIVKGILIPYGTLATAILTILPFIIFFFFIHNTIESTGGRKIAWIFYMVVMFGIWANRQGQLNDLENYIYGAIFIISILLFFFDRKVREYFDLREASKSVYDVNMGAYQDALIKAKKATDAAELRLGKDNTLNKAAYEAQANVVRAKSRLGGGSSILRRFGY